QEVVVSVSDSGTGMAPETVRRVFEPFFTTKPVGAGTGLGLSVCKGIIDSLGGDLTVETEPGLGSVFRVRLPVASAETTENPERTDAPKLSGRVLVVDDDEIVAKSVARMLEATHQVEVANDARSALVMLSQEPLFDVVVCDLLMPRLSGIELYKRLAERRPEQAARFVFMSGAFTSEASEFLAQVPNPRLPKPPSPGELEVCVQRLLRTEPSRSGCHRLEQAAPRMKAGRGSG